MSKSILYAVNTTAQTVTPSQVISFGVPVRRYGNNLNVVGGNVVESGSGYYGYEANISLQATGTGLATVTMYKDGIAIPGATQSVTVGTTDTTVAFNIPFIDRLTSCPCVEHVITAVLSGEITSASVTNAAIVGEKL